MITQSEEILRDARNVGAPSPQTGEKGFSVVRFNISTSAATCLGYNIGLRKRNVDLSQISHGISQVFKVRRSLAVLDDNALGGHFRQQTLLFRAGHTTFPRHSRSQQISRPCACP